VIFPVARLLQRLWMAALGGGVLLTATVGGAREVSGGLERVTLQLKWKHQFQFAGYYAAIAQGYYREAGLDVRLVEAQPGQDPVEAVLAGRAEFGVGTSELVLLRARGEPVVVLAAIYQHSPLVLLARHTAEVQDLQALADRPIMVEPQSAELFAYFRNEGVDPARLRIEHHTFEVQDLVNGRVAAMTAYSTDEPFLLKAAGLDYLVFMPRAGGIDFYGDNLFATEAQVARYPDRVRKFRAASLRGWEYALAHPEEIIALILREHGERKSRAHLEFEAAQTAQLMHPGLIEVGHMNPGRWRHIAETYAEFGMVPVGFDLEEMLYDPDPRPDLRWVYWTLAVAGVLLVAALGWVLPLMRLNRRLREADAAKSRYLAFLTHEIRTPLNGIVGLTDLLKSDPLSTDQREQVQLLDRSAQNLLRLVDNVLDHSKLEAGLLTSERGPVELAGLVRDLGEMFTPAARTKGLALRWEIQAGVPAMVDTDALRLRQILANLLANALKFTAAGVIELTVALQPSAAGARLCFAVRDTGIGIPAESLAHLFQPYRQADTSIARRFGGSGLGLSISRQLAQLLGGDITVTSVPGRGSTFTLEIPVEPVSAA
jgi:signal transduction histidine kinase/ABC-type nitrate/sulfonate/bicarbonate transport system substrate-binding protein